MRPVCSLGRLALRLLYVVPGPDGPPGSSPNIDHQHHRPSTPIIAASPKEETVRRLMLTWGVRPIFIPEFGSTDGIVETALAAAQSPISLRQEQRSLLPVRVRR